MGFTDSLKALLGFKQDALNQLREENDTLKDSVVACRQALAACDGHSFNLERDLLVANQSPENYYKWARNQVGDIARYETYWGIVVEELADMGIKWMALSAPDSKIFYTDEATMSKIVPYLTYPADRATESLSIDCDDYSLWAQADASRIFNLSAVFQVWGGIPAGYHAFSMARVGENQYRIWEPNAGLEAAGGLFVIGINGYRPDKWK